MDQKGFLKKIEDLEAVKIVNEDHKKNIRKKIINLLNQSDLMDSEKRRRLAQWERKTSPQDVSND